MEVVAKDSLDVLPVFRVALRCFPRAVRWVLSSAIRVPSGCASLRRLQVVALGQQNPWILAR